MVGKEKSLKKVCGVALASLMYIVLSGSAELFAQSQPPVREIDRTTGAYYYGRYGCSACHGGAGAGTVIGVPIAGRPTGPLTRDQIV